MSVISEKFARVALANLQKYGTSCTLRRIVAGAFDPATSMASVAETTHPAFGYIESVEQSSERGSSEDASDIITSRRKVTIAAKGIPVVPVPGDRIGILEDRTWNIVAVTPISLHNQYIMFEMIVKA